MSCCRAVHSLVQTALGIEHSGLHLGSYTQAWTEQSRMFKETIMTMMKTHNFAMEVNLFPSVLAGGGTPNL